MYLHCLDLFHGLHIGTISWWNFYCTILLRPSPFLPFEKGIRWKSLFFYKHYPQNNSKSRGRSSIAVDSFHTNTQFRHREPPTTRTHRFPSTSPSYLGLRYTSQTYNVVQSDWYSMLHINSSSIIPTLRYTHSRAHKAAKWGWEAVYTMDPKVVPRLCKICDWLLNSSRDHFSLHQWKNVKVTMAFKVPKRHVVRPTSSTNMVFVVGEAKEVLYQKKAGIHGREMML